MVWGSSPQTQCQKSSLCHALGMVNPRAALWMCAAPSSYRSSLMWRRNGLGCCKSNQGVEVGFPPGRTWQPLASRRAAENPSLQETGMGM